MTNFIFSRKQKKYFILKRFFDILISFFALVFLFPIFLLVTILVLISSPGPVLFKQKRPGYKKIGFTMYKFRTMRIQLKKNNRFLTDQERITRIGNFLRKSSLDELPQLVNVLFGQMSLIGPRPFLFNDLPEYTLEEQIRFLVKPGMTSWTSINGRNSLQRKKKFELEVFYVKNIGFKLDFIIFIKTFFVVFGRKNVYDNVNPKRIAGKIVE